MGIELVLKLLEQVDIGFYVLQDEKGNVPRWGGDYHGKTIAGTQLSMEFEADQEFTTFHAYVIYGYERDEFLVVTKHHNDAPIHYINDMKTRLTNIQGSDILTFNVIKKL